MNNTNGRQDREISDAQSLNANDAISSLISIIEELDNDLTETKSELDKAHDQISELESKVQNLEEQVAAAL